MRVNKIKEGLERGGKKEKEECIATLASPWDFAWLSVYVYDRDSDRE